MTSIIYRLGNYIGDGVDGAINLPAGAGEVVSLAGETIAGLLGTLLTVATFGSVTKYQATAKRTENSALMLPRIYSAVMAILNQDAKRQYRDWNHFGGAKQGMVRKTIDLFGVAEVYAKDNPRIISKLLYITAGVLAVTARIVDLALAILLVIASLTLLGQWKTLNETVMYQLTGLGVIDDVCRTSLLLAGCVEKQTY